MSRWRKFDSYYQFEHLRTLSPRNDSPQAEDQLSFGEFRSTILWGATEPIPTPDTNCYPLPRAMNSRRTNAYHEAGSAAILYVRSVPAVGTGHLYYP